MALPTFLPGLLIWTLSLKDLSRIQAAEMKFLRPVKGCTILDKVRNKYKAYNTGIPPGLVGPHPTYVT